MTGAHVKRWLRRAAVLVFAGMLAWWLVSGAHRGWTMTSVPTRVLDDITGIEAVVYEKRLVPGVDLLGLAAGLSLFLAGLSCLARSPKAAAPAAQPPTLK